jgi:hypothetical protein
VLFERMKQQMELPFWRAGVATDGKPPVRRADCGHDLSIVRSCRRWPASRAGLGRRFGLGLETTHLAHPCARSVLGLLAERRYGNTPLMKPLKRVFGGSGAREIRSVKLKMCRRS